MLSFCFSVESLDFLPCWHASAESVIHLEYHLWWWLPGFQQDTLPTSELCAECKYKGLLVVPYPFWRSFGKFLKFQTVLSLPYSWRMRVPRNAIMMAWLRKKCPTASCSLICKGCAKTVGVGGHPTLKLWWPSHKNMCSAISYTALNCKGKQ